MGLSLNCIKKGQINHKSDIYVAFSQSKDTNNAMKLLDEGLVNINR